MRASGYQSVSYWDIITIDIFFGTHVYNNIYITICFDRIQSNIY